MKTYLIQRGKFESNKNSKGIDSILSFDYMGSAEFEFGALPKSLSNIRKNLDEYSYADFIVKDKTITVFCKKSHEDEILQYLKDLSNNKMRLKHMSAFDKYVNDDGYFANKFDFWWDIENDIMFWKKNDDFLTKFKTCISIN